MFLKIEFSDYSAKKKKKHFLSQEAKVTDDQL